MLADLEFQYDSSIVPARHDLYGIPQARREPHRLLLSSGRTIKEFPPATVRLCGMNLPFGGGGYFRFYPYMMTEWGLRSINQSENTPFAFYIHPWELDVDQPRIDAGRLSRFRHYNNIDKCESRFRKLLQSFEFNSMSSVLGHIDLDTAKIDTDGTNNRG